MINRSGHNAAYVIDTQRQLPNGYNRHAAEFRADSMQEVEEQLAQWMIDNAPQHYTTPNHERRYRVIIVGA